MSAPAPDGGGRARRVDAPVLAPDAGTRDGGTPDAGIAEGAVAEGGIGETCGIVLAGTYAWGEGPDERLPRGPLLPVAQTPIIVYPLAWLRRHGVREAVVCASGSTAAVRRLLGDGSMLGLALRYLEDLAPRGPAGCASDAARLTTARTLVVVDGSLIPSLPLGDLLAAHRRAHAAATTVVELDRRRGGMRGDRRRLAGGIYVFERHLLDADSGPGYQDIKEGLLGRLYARGERVLAHEVPGVTPRILDLATYASVSGWLIGAAAGREDLLPGYARVADGCHHRSAVLHPDARVIGPVLLGPNTHVGADAILVGPTSIGAGSVVREGAIVARSILWERCTVGRGARVDASLLGHGATVRAGEHLVGERRPGGAPPSGEPLLPHVSGMAESVPIADERSLVHPPAAFTLAPRRDAGPATRV